MLINVIQYHKGNIEKSLHGKFSGMNIKEQDASNIEAILELKIPTKYSYMTITYGVNFKSEILLL